MLCSIFWGKIVEGARSNLLLNRDNITERFINSNISLFSMQIPIETYEDRLNALYIRRVMLDSQTSAAMRQRKEELPNWDSYGHDGFCWNQRNLRDIVTEIAFLEEAIPLLRKGLPIDHLAEHFASQVERNAADNYRRPASFPSKDVGIYQKNEFKELK